MSIESLSTEKLIVEMRSTLINVFNIPPGEELEQKLQNIKDMLNLNLSPNNFFDFVGAGSFKEAYHFMPGIIIKFASLNNNTEEEERTYNATYSYYVDGLFAKTEYYWLDGIHPLSDYIEGDGTADIEHLDEADDSQLYNVIIFQEEVKMMPKGLDGDYLKYFTQPVAKQIDLLEGNFKWFKDVEDKWGKEFLNKFFEYCEEYGISDLATRNVGYTIDTGLPIIVDWLSY